MKALGKTLTKNRKKGRKNMNHKSLGRYLPDLSGSTAEKKLLCVFPNSSPTIIVIIIFGSLKGTAQ